MNLPITVGVVLALVLLGVAHSRLARLAPFWPGAVIPALWVVVVACLVATGYVNSVADVLMFVFVSIVLARIWVEGRNKRAARATAA